MNQEQLLGVRDKILARLPENIFLQIGNVRECKVIFNHRMKTAAGRAFTTKNIIHLNPKLLEHGEEEFMNTFAHELAHLIDFKLNGRSSHGWRFQRIMRSLGYQPTRTHDLPWEINRHRVVCRATCKCVGKSFEIKPRRYRAIMRGTVYRCNVCYSPLTLIIRE